MRLIKSLYICSARVHHASRKAAYQGGTFILYTMKYSNKPLSAAELISQMKMRGLIIGNEQQAEECLKHISYFRLATYLRPMEADNLHHYKENSRFENAVSIYNFDARLRHLIFAAIQKIEISLRANMINVFSMKYGAMWFLNPDLAIDKHNYTDNLSVLERELKRSKEDFIKEHAKKYGKEEYPPVWKLLELASFGCLTKLFCNFSDIKIKKTIGRSYSVPQNENLESWMISIGALRNACAHHGRVWNRIMPITPQLPQTLCNDWIVEKPIPNRLYAVLSCMLYWLNVIEPSNTFLVDLKSLLAEYPNIDTNAMGFPSGWNNEKLWNCNN